MTDNSLEPDLRNQRKAGKDRTEERSPVIRGLNQGQLKIWMELSIKLQKKTGKGYQRSNQISPQEYWRNFESSQIGQFWVFRSFLQRSLAKKPMRDWKRIENKQVFLANCQQHIRDEPLKLIESFPLKSSFLWQRSTTWDSFKSDQFTAFKVHANSKSVIAGFKEETLIHDNSGVLFIEIYNKQQLIVWYKMLRGKDNMYLFYIF